MIRSLLLLPLDEAHDVEAFLAEALSRTPVRYTKIPRRSMARDPRGGKGSKTGQAGVDYENAFLVACNMLGLDYAEQKGSALWDLRPLGPGWEKLIKNKDVNIKVAHTKWMFSDSILKRMFPWSEQEFAKYGPSVFAGKRYTPKVAEAMRKQGKILPANPTLIAAHEKRIQIYYRSVMKLQNYLFMAPKSPQIQRSIVKAARFAYRIGFDAIKGVPRDLDDEGRRKLGMTLDRLYQLFRAENFHTYKFPRSFDVRIYLMNRNNVLDPKNFIKKVDFLVKGKPVAKAENNVGSKEDREAGKVRILVTGYGPNNKPPRQGFDHGPAKIHRAKATKNRPWMDTNVDDADHVLNAAPKQAATVDVLLPDKSMEGTFARAVSYLARELRGKNGKPLIGLTSGRGHIRIGIFSFKASSGLNKLNIFPPLSTTKTSSFKFVKQGAVVFEDDELSKQLPWEGSFQTFDDLFTNRLRDYAGHKRLLGTQGGKQAWEKFASSGAFAVTNKQTLLLTLENYIQDVLKAIGVKAIKIGPGDRSKKDKGKTSAQNESADFNDADDEELLAKGDVYYVASQKKTAAEVRRLNRAYESGNMKGGAYVDALSQALRSALSSNGLRYYKTPERVHIQFELTDDGEAVDRVEIFGRKSKKLFMVANYDPKSRSVVFRMPKVKEVKAAKFRPKSLKAAALKAKAAGEQGGRDSAGARIMKQIGDQLPRQIAAPWTKAKTKADFAAEAAEAKERYNNAKGRISEARKALESHKKRSSKAMASALSAFKKAKDATARRADAFADEAESHAAEAAQALRDAQAAHENIVSKIAELKRIVSRSPYLTDRKAQVEKISLKTPERWLDLSRSNANSARKAAEKTRDLAEKKAQAETGSVVKKGNAEMAKVLAKIESLNPRRFRS